MKEFHGVWSDHCVVDEDLTFHGIAEAGLTVCTGVTVNLYGLLQGPVLVEKDAKLTIYGLLEGEIDDQGGRVVVRGTTNGSGGEPAFRQDL